MPAKLFAARGRGGRVTAAACACFLLGVGLASPPVQAQSDVADRAPWQAPPGCQPEFAPICQPARSCDRCAPSASVCGDEGDCEECGGGAGRRCGGNPDCDFSNPCLCGLGSLFGCDRFWLRAEYLLWWDKSANLPPLATTSPQGTAYNQAGVLGPAGHHGPVRGKRRSGARSGARLTLGYWLSDCHDLGLEATYLFLGNKAAVFNQTSQGDPILARPFYNVQTAAQDATVIAYGQQPDEARVQTGSLDIRDASELDSVEVLFRQVLFQRCGRQLDFLFGYRYGRFSENLSVDSSTTFVSGFATPDGTVSQVSDLFAASNEFNGAELGFAAKTRCCRLSMELLGKLAIGSTQSRVNVNGSTVVTEPGQQPVTYTGGLLALPTNSGSYQQNDLSVVPELGITLGYDFTCRLKATFGYTLMYWSRVARPGRPGRHRPESVPVPARTTRRHPGAPVQVRDHGFLGAGAQLRPRLPLLGRQPIRGLCEGGVQRGVGRRGLPTLPAASVSVTL